MKLKKLSADIITMSHEGPDLNTTQVGGDDRSPVIVDWPGEYEYRRISIIGIQTWQNKKDEEGSTNTNTAFTYLIDDLHICHLGYLGHALTTEQLDEIGDVDILLLPVGGIGSFDSNKAKEVMEKIEPRIVLPMYYAMPGSSLKFPTRESFVKLLDKDAEKMETLKISKRELPSDDDTKLILLDVK